MITGGVILICLTIGILVPDIELVLGLVGSTMGSCVCTILPALMFLKLTTKVRHGFLSISNTLKGSLTATKAALLAE